MRIKKQHNSRLGKAKIHVANTCWSIVIIRISPILLFFILLLTQGQLIAQSWVSGKVTFHDGQTYDAEFSMDNFLVEGLLMVRDGDAKAIFTPEKINKFEYYDELVQKTRTYISLPIKIYDRYKRTFMELVVEGKRFSICRRVWTLHKRGELLSKSPTNSSKVRDYEVLYLINKQTSLLYPYTDPNYYKPKRAKYDGISKKMLNECLGNRKGLIKAFAKDNQLSYYDVRDLIKMIEYDNTLI